MSNSDFWVNFFFNLKIRINIKLNIKSFIYRFDSKIKTNPILLAYLEEIFHLLWNLEFNFRIIYFNGEFIIKTKLLSTFIKPCRHFKIKIRDCLRSHYLFFILLSKSNAVRNTTSSLYYFINNVISYWTIFETDYVYNTIRFDCVFRCQLLIDQFGLLQMWWLLCLPKANIW